MSKLIKRLLTFFIGIPLVLFIVFVPAYLLFLSFHGQSHGVGPVVAVELSGVKEGVGQGGGPDAGAAVVHLQVQGHLLPGGEGLAVLQPHGPPAGAGVQFPVHVGDGGGVAVPARPVLEVDGDLVPAEDDAQPEGVALPGGQSPLRQGLPGPVGPGQHRDGVAGHVLPGGELVQAVLRLGAPHQIEQGVLLLGEGQGLEQVGGGGLLRLLVAAGAPRQQQAQGQNGTKQLFHTNPLFLYGY